MDAHRRSLARLSSGNRIVNPADDAGGLAVGNKLDSKLSRLEKVHQNLKNTISFTELQESALRTVGTIITRMSELKTMSTDVTKNSADIENYNKEFVELQKQIEAMTKHKFNGVSLFSNTSKFAETDADGRSGHGVDLARNFVFDEYVAQSGAVLGQGTTTTTTVPGAGGGSGAGGGESSTTYTLDQWRADYDEWINYDDSNWDNDFLTWMANPEPYGGVDVLNQIKNIRDNPLTYPHNHFSGDDSWIALDLDNVTDLTPLAGLKNVPDLKDIDVTGNPNLDLSPLASLTQLEIVSSRGNLNPDLTPLAGLTNMKSLHLDRNNITDLSPLAALTEVDSLDLDRNNIEDISPLQNLSQIEVISLVDNEISNISPLQNLTNIDLLFLERNNISDLSPLVGMTSSRGITLGGYDPVVEDPPEKENPITQSQKDMLEAALPTTNIGWPDPILPDPVEPKAPTTTITTTGYPSLDQFTTEDFTNFTQSVASAMAEVGSHQSRLNMQVRQNESARVNLEAAKSRIMDANMAQESSRFAKTNVLVQSSASMVAQANQLSDIALRLMVNR
jgi:flagellin-like hook-associated protein FlgL